MSQTVTVISVEVTKAGRTDRIVLNYVNEKNETRRIGALAVKLDEASRTKVLAAKPGDVVSIDKAKEGEYWNLTKVSEAALAPNVASKATSSGTYAKKSAYDDTGVKVGASRNQAIAMLSSGRFVCTAITGEACGHVSIETFSLDDVDKVSYEIINRQAAQEANVRAGVSPAKKSNVIPVGGTVHDTLSQEQELTLEMQYAQAQSDDTDF